MNRPQAAVLLGGKESASAAEIRKAYLTRSRLLHPDRFSGSPAEDIQAAIAAMSQINAAYEILTNEDSNKATDPGALIVQCGTCGQRNRVSTPERVVCSICKEDLRPKQQARGAEHADAGFPRWGHGESSCSICGWGPARQVKFNSVTGWIIFWRWFTFEAACCRRLRREPLDALVEAARVSRGDRYCTDRDHRDHLRCAVRADQDRLRATASIHLRSDNRPGRKLLGRYGRHDGV